jgi:hypothetical protein
MFSNLFFDEIDYSSQGGPVECEFGSGRFKKPGQRRTVAE